MSEGRRGIALTPMETRRDVIVQAAILADELGYEVFSVPEGWGLDSTIILTEIALRTRRIRLLSGVLSAGGRTPATLAMTAATLHQISSGRYVLGLGASTRALVEGFHNQHFARPASRLRETLIGVRSLLGGERACLRNGSTSRPIRLGQAAIPDLPIWLAALGSRTVKLAAELADGWMPIFMTRESIGACMNELGGVRQTAGPQVRPFTLAAGPTVVVDDDADVARRSAGSMLAWYLCAMGDIYGRCVVSQGYASAVAAVQHANPQLKPGDGVIPAEADDLLAEFAAFGTCAHVRDQLATWDPVVDVVMMSLPPGVAWCTVEATLRAGAPEGDSG